MISLEDTKRIMIVALLLAVEIYGDDFVAEIEKALEEQA